MWDWISLHYTSNTSKILFLTKLIFTFYQNFYVPRQISLQTQLSLFWSHNNFSLCRETVWDFQTWNLLPIFLALLSDRVLLLCYLYGLAECTLNLYSSDWSPSQRCCRSNQSRFILQCPILDILNSRNLVSGKNLGGDSTSCIK